MSDPRFFQPLGPFSAAHIANAVGAELRGNGTIMIRDVGSLSSAQGDQVTFLDNQKYNDQLAGTKAGAIIVSRALADSAPIAATLLVHDHPYKTYARVAQLFHPIAPPMVGVVSPHAIIDPSAIVGDNCTIDAGAIIGPRAHIGDNVQIGPNAVIGAAVQIGAGTIIGACASLTHCIVGQRVNILPGARIGQNGFGFAIDPAGHLRIPQLGRVVIEDDVEIGANTTIDRGAGPDTIIGRGAMIDNLVQIAHNVVIGPGSIIAAQAGVSGSSVLEAGVALGGQVGVAGHLKLGRGAQIAGQSGIMRDVKAGERMMGTPALPQKQFFRQITWLEAMISGKRKKQE